MTDEEYISLLDKLIRFCSYAERCKFDVVRKMYSLSIPKGIHDDIIRDLEERNVLNERRYADSFAEGKLRFNQWGRLKIRAHLKSRGVQEQDVERALQRIDQSEYLEILQHILYKKKSNRSENRIDPKVVRYAQGKGFELNLILEEWKKLDN